MLEKPAFIQGLFNFEGRGLGGPSGFHPPVTYQVPPDKRAQTIYFRAGNASAEMIYLVLTSGGKPMRYFPVGAKGAVHVPLAVIEDLSPGSTIEILAAAPEGLKLAVLLDVGFLEID
ncbi:MAG: molybdopterin oxidoreductase [Acidobacteriota bacterium]|nr:molybdopterin oxidoreductase [Acidobacteriota bacterium]